MQGTGRTVVFQAQNGIKLRYGCCVPQHRHRSCTVAAVLLTKNLHLAYCRGNLFRRRHYDNNDYCICSTATGGEAAPSSASQAAEASVLRPTHSGWRIYRE